MNQECAAYLNGHRCERPLFHGKHPHRAFVYAPERPGFPDVIEWGGDLAVPTRRSTAPAPATEARGWEVVTADGHRFAAVDREDAEGLCNEGEEIQFNGEAVDPRPGNKELREVMHNDDECGDCLRYSAEDAAPATEEGSDRG